MWKLLKSELKYSIIVISILLFINLVYNVIMFFLPIVELDIAIQEFDFLNHVIPLFLILYFHYRWLKEKRDRYFSTLPVKRHNIALARIMFFLLPLAVFHIINILTAYNVVHAPPSIWVHRYMNVSLVGLYLMATVVLITIFDIYNSMPKNGKIMKILGSLLAGGIFVVMGILTFRYGVSLMDRLANDNNIAEHMLRTRFVIYYHSNSFALFGILLGVISVYFYRMRKSFV